ncbi:MAG: histidine triad nucleotide-binding protein [Actinobacteria bacterium]|nr:MAG: histidine triad nucleotide-binding protein [Actinomycetota bacterium]
MTIDPDCLFCKIVAGEIPSTVVLNRGNVFAFRDVNPQAPTHILVVPKEHVRDVSVLDESAGPLLAELVVAANELARSEGIVSSGYRLVANVGPDAGQTVFHLHVHLLGGRPMGWPPG